VGSTRSNCFQDAGQVMSRKVMGEVRARTLRWLQAR